MRIRQTVNVAHIEATRKITKFHSEDLKEKPHLDDVGRDEKIIGLLYRVIVLSDDYRLPLPHECIPLK
jgi:hypothetical protein